jgi:hypothetical protein
VVPAATPIGGSAFDWFRHLVFYRRFYGTAPCRAFTAPGGMFLVGTKSDSCFLLSLASPGPALHCTALHCTALHCTALHCTGPRFRRWHAARNTWATREAGGEGARERVLLRGCKGEGARERVLGRGCWGEGARERVLGRGRPMMFCPNILMFASKFPC